MRVLILNGSPKRKGSTSGLLGRAAGALLHGCETHYASLRVKREYPSILAWLREIDVLILAAPLYVDGIPSHVLEFLQEAEGFCRENDCRFTLYAISNNGFIEGAHNGVHLKMYECWCRRAGVDWGGGIGIGGGEMLGVISVYFPIAFAVITVVNIVRYALGAPPDFADWRPLLESAAVWLVFICGAAYCLLRLTACARKRVRTKNRFTRVMVPSFLFIPMADIFMVVSALLNGKNIFRLLRPDTYDESPDT